MSLVTILRIPTARRWAVPVAAAVAIAAAGAVSARPASAIDLPDLTPEQVLVLAQSSDVRAFSGTAELTVDLGLPRLPGASSAASDPSALLSGDTRMRVWVDGPQRQRLQVMRQWSQLDLVHSSRDLWAYDSDANVYRYAQLPAGYSAGSDHLPDQAMTPQEIARRVLAAVDASTAVSVGRDVQVAGRSAYELRLEPRTADTLVGQVALAVDSETGMALRVSVTARGASEPAVLVGFTSLDLSTPARERFEVDPPEGADVETLTLPTPPDGWHKDHPDGWHEDGTGDADDADGADGADGADHPTPPAADSRVQIVGPGWAGIVVVDAAGALDGLDPMMLEALTTPVDGGRALSGALFSVLLTDDGRVLAGAVPVDALVAAAR